MPETETIEDSSPLDPLSVRILGALENTSPPTTRASFPGDMTALKLSEMVKNRIFESEVGTTDIESIKAEITFNDPTSITHIIETLKTYGLAIFPAIYSDEQLLNVKSEYESLMTDEGKDFMLGCDERTDTSSHSLGMRYNRNTMPERYSEIHTLFGSEIIRTIATEMFNGQPFDFNNHLYSQRTYETTAPASGVLHWDKQMTLKSWLYVTAGEEEHGPMRAAVGSNRWLRYAREDAMFDGIPYGAIDNSVDETDLPIVPTGGPAGTFFLFLTDTAHGASQVHKGFERNIIRAQSRPNRIASWASWANKKIA